MDEREAGGLNATSASIIGAAIEVHRELGPGLLESIYQDCLALELVRQGTVVEKEVELPLCYKGERTGKCLRVDLVVARNVIVEVKAVERLLPIHSAQLLSYLRLSGIKLGLLLNFNVDLMRRGIRRVVNAF